MQGLVWKVEDRETVCFFPLLMTWMGRTITWSISLVCYEKVYFKVTG